MFANGQWFNKFTSLKYLLLALKLYVYYFIKSQAELFNQL